MKAALAIAAYGLAFFLATSPQKARYDCALAVWHPDYPKAVREACRRLL